jgi:hypothetical protein
MSEQEGTLTPTKRRRSHKVNSANQQDSKQVLTLLLSTTNGVEDWKAYWKTQGQTWRTEPEIEVERQKYLTQRRSITPVIEQGIYPFKDIKLSRADVEWLLATHDNGRGPIFLLQEGQYKRNGPDLRGANLNNVNLSRLALARIIGGLVWDDWIPATQEQRELAGIHLEEANLRRAHLEGAHLNNAYMEKANCSWAFLMSANLANTHLEHSNLYRAHLQEASLLEAHLARCQLSGTFFDVITNLEGIHLSSEKLGIISLVDISWGRVNLSVVNWSSIKMLGNESKAKNSKLLEDYQTAVRANRQLAVALEEQGLNEDAARFAYRAQNLQRVVLRKQKKGLS